MSARAVEGLQDLDALLLGDADALHPGPWVDRQAEALAELGDLALGRAQVDHRSPVGLGGQDDVLRDREHRDELEVLVHHPDAVIDRVAGGAHAQRLAPQEDLALVGQVQPVEHVHQRALAGAVLTEQRVDLALAEVEVHVVVGDHAREPHRDPPKLEERRGVLGHGQEATESDL